MKTVKKVLLYGLGAIVALIALVLITALFVTKDYAVEREIVINKPKQQVFDYVKQSINMEHYNKWVMRDPNMKKEYRGTDGTEGFVYAWDSKEAGKGEQEIKKITEGERVDYEIRFEKPMEGISISYMTTEAMGDNQTKVKWFFSGTQKYPINFMNLFTGKLLGGDLEQSLGNLKGNLEKE